VRDANTKAYLVAPRLIAQTQITAKPNCSPWEPSLIPFGGAKPLPSVSS
jgi:hypothetical protein